MDRISGDLIEQGNALLAATKISLAAVSSNELVVVFDADEEEIRIESRNGQILAMSKY